MSDCFGGRYIENQKFLLSLDLLVSRNFGTKSTQ